MMDKYLDDQCRFLIYSYFRTVVPNHTNIIPTINSISGTKKTLVFLRALSILVLILNLEFFNSKVYVSCTRSSSTFKKVVPERVPSAQP